MTNKDEDLCDRIQEFKRVVEDYIRLREQKENVVWNFYYASDKIMFQKSPEQSSVCRIDFFISKHGERNLSFADVSLLALSYDLDHCDSKEEAVKQKFQEAVRLSETFQIPRRHSITFSS